MARTTIQLPSILLVSFLGLMLAGCGGSDGDTGATGATGDTGLSCWDLNENGVADPEEDLNGDGVIDVLDCREPLPGTNILVDGSVSTEAGPLDRFTSVFFVPTGTMTAAQKGSLPHMAAKPEGAIEAEVAADGSYTAFLDVGMYDALASRPGYEDVEELGFEVTAEGGTLDFVLPEVPDGEYIGSEDCGVCHTTYYASFVQTGHPYKLNRAFGEQPIYPFTTLNGVLERIDDEDGQTDNSLGTPQSYDDVSYVIGGYYWKARFVDLAGAVVTGSEVQYNFATDEMVAYHDDEVDKPYNCGNCHTTGWRHQDDVLNPDREDDMKFMDGTFFKGGIQCEACHSAGAEHARFQGGIVREAEPRTLLELTADDAGYGLAIACGECHTRDGERDYSSYVSKFDQALIDNAVIDTRPDEMGGRIAASKGLIRHHEQYDEIVGIDPDTLMSVRSGGFFGTHGDCGTCHDPHGSSVNVDNTLYTGVAGVDKSNDSCERCHSEYDPQLRTGGMQGLNCIDCHMPKLAKSAVAWPPVAEGAPTTGDVTSHIFRIELHSDFQQFTDDGAFAYPWVTTDWACRTCHNAAFFEIGSTDNYVFHNNK